MNQNEITEKVNKIVDQRMRSFSVESTIYIAETLKYDFGFTPEQITQFMQGFQKRVADNRKGWAKR